MTNRSRIDRASIDHLYLGASMMSNEGLREIAKRRDLEGAVARRELAQRDDEVTFAHREPDA